MTKVQINPPPTDRKCDRCGTHVDDLKPFGGPGDPLVGDFTGQKLVKFFRALCEESIEKYDRVLAEQDRLLEFTDNIWEEGIQTTLEQTFGSEIVDEAYLYDQACNTMGSSWECRDCIIK